jgi:hypothetical protein
VRIVVEKHYFTSNFQERCNRFNWKLTHYG